MGRWKVILFYCVLFASTEAQITFDEEPRDVLIAEGGRATFNCSIITQTGASLRWYKGSEPVVSSGRSQIAVNGTLTIEPTTAGDNATYTCSWTSSAGSFNRSATLRFAYFDSRITRNPESQTISEGNSVSFFCLHGNSLPAANISWMFNNELITSTNYPEFTISTHSLSETRTSSTLFLSAAELTHSGTYTCRASNILLPSSSVESTAASLTVTVVPRPPNITEQPQDITVPFEGGQATFSCSFTGQPPPTAVWLFNGSELSETEGMSITSNNRRTALSLSSVSSADVGSYQCRLSNAHGQVTSRAASLVLASIGSVFQTPPPDTEAILGRNVSIPCDPPPSVPPANVTWTKNFFQLSRSRFVVAPDNRLLIYSVQLTDAGEYYCTATNPVSMVSRIGGPASLTVLTPPSITQAPQNVSAPVGTAAVFTCVASGNPSPNIEWLGPSDVVIESSSKYILSVNELRIASVARSDEGSYTCKADTRAGTARQQAYLDVQYAPEVLVSEMTVTVTEGDPTSLPCHISGNPSTSFSWDKNGVDVLEPQSNRFSLSNHDGTLLISSVEKVDEGVYHCTLTNDLGSASSDVHLRVLVPASIQSVMTPVTVVTGAPVSLSCEASGDPEPSVWWTLNGQPFPNSNVSSRVSVVNGNQTLTFSETQKSDEGIYMCTAVNSIQSDSDDVILVVYVPPTITTPAVSVEIVEGEGTILDCTSSGDPTPSVSWSKDSQQVVLDSNTVQYTNGSLVLSSVVEREEGTYTCVAANPGGNASLSHQLDVKVPAEAVLPQNMSLVSGASGRVDCVIRGDPAPSVNWFQPDGTMVTTSSLSRIRSLGNGMLLFTMVTPQDEGVYTCEATNSLGVDSEAINVLVFVHPVATAAADEVRVVIGTNVTLGCSATGTPPPVVTWSRNSSLITTTGRISFTGSNLNIRAVTHSDGGTYKCEAVNVVGSASDLVLLTTLEEPTAATPPSVTVVAGQSGVIACQTSGVPVPTVNWFDPDGTLLSTSSSVAIATNGSLIITLTSAEDGGTFRCTATNEVGMATSTVAVTVHVHPSIATANSEVIAIIGETAELECVVNGNPPPIITWSRNNSALTDPRISQQSGLLTVSSVTLSDEGVYTCSATNLVGVAAANVSLVINDRPRIDVALSNRIIHVNQSVDLYCNATGKPLPRLSWSHNSTVISGATQSRLSISMATTGSEGTYTCTASNEAGVAVTMAILSILYPPDPPTLNTITAVSSTSLSVSWTVSGNGGSTITGFLVDYRASSQTSYDTVTISLAFATMATVTGLSPYIQYNIRVRAVNAIGSSGPSDVLTERTLPEAPSLPRNLRISSTTLFSVVVAWDQPDPLNGPFFAYSVRYSEEGSTAQTEITLSPSFNIGDLIRGSVYIFAVRAGVTSGANILWGQYVEIRIQDGAIIGTVSTSAAMTTSSPVTATPTSTRMTPSVMSTTTTTSSSQSVSSSPTTSLPPMPSQTPISSAVPRDLTVRTIGANTGFVSWREPVEPIEDFDGYRIFVSPPPPSSDGEFEVQLSQTSLVLQSLAFFSNYSVQVSVYNENGNGVKTLPVTFATGEGSPTSPINVEVTLLTSSSAQVTWQSPDPPNGMITQYDVRLVDTETSIARTISANPATDGTSVTVEGLVTGRMYIVTVRARNTLLIGPYSSPVEFRAVLVTMETASPTQTPISTLSIVSTQILSTSSLLGATSSPTVLISVTSTGSMIPGMTITTVSTATTPPSTGLSQENLIAVVVIASIIGLVLCVVVTTVIIVVCRKWRKKPEKWDVYNRMNNEHKISNEPDRRNKYLVPSRDSESDIGYPMYETGNFTFGDRDSPHEASDFSDDDHLDNKNESECFQGTNPRYVGVSDRKRLIGQSKRSSLPVVTEEVFDDPTYAQITKPQETKAVHKKPKVTNVGILTNEGPVDQTYADVNIMKARKAQQKAEKTAKRASRDTLDSQVTSSSTGMYTSWETIDSQRMGRGKGRGSRGTLDSQGMGGVKRRSSRDTLDSNRSSSGYVVRDSRSSRDTDSMRTDDAYQGRRRSREMVEHSGNHRWSGSGLPEHYF